MDPARPAKRSGAAVSEKPGPAVGQRAGQPAGDAVLGNRDDKMVDGEAVSPGADPVLERALAKISRRVIPLFMATVFMNYLDRSNLSYAALVLNRDNGFDAKTFATGVSLFYATFAAFQVPANLVMVRVGFRPWLAFLLMAWGIVAVCFMFISSVWSFYLLRLLLGVFEAGSYPAMWYALTVFFPRRRVTMPHAYLAMGIMLSNMVGSLLATGLLAMDGLGGLRGWQWLFMLEGIPSILLGGLMFVLLPGSIAAARFLTPEEREALAAEVARDHLDGALDYDRRTLLRLLRETLTNGYVWVVCFSGILMSISTNTYSIFTPIIFSNLLNGTAFSSAATVAAAAGNKTLLPVALTVVPYTLAIVFGYLLSYSMQRHDEHMIHMSSALVIAGVLMALFAPLAHAAVWLGFVGLSLSLASTLSTAGPGMVVVARLCKGREVVVAQPVVQTFNLMGGVIGPPIAAAMMKSKGGFTWLSVIFGLLLVICSCILLALRAWVMRDGGMPDGGIGRKRKQEAALPAGQAAVEDAPRVHGRAAAAAKDGNTLC
ncbi:MFS transporter [Raphidocelis subcapitata]|uniref:MFS transporter n=1 Tax=Raphidocelis subcapitata TaxID=307507 RepID=A0A2V0PNR7_9CHLO|nr:MFS transporter [Raphidocelis subcapitata]|eukprot:GBF99610.1 MFS transporter [Raphidocelis subcapitata]